MKTRYLLPILAVLLLCCHWIGAKISEPVQPTMTAATTSAPPLPPLEPVATSFAKFEAANLRASATAFTPDQCGPDPRVCTMTIVFGPVGCKPDFIGTPRCAADLAWAEGKTLYISRPNFAGFAAECYLHNGKCAPVTISTPRTAYGDPRMQFVYATDGNEVHEQSLPFGIVIR